VDHPPTAVRLTTRISDFATTVCTDVPFVLGDDFISIAAAEVKQNAARSGRDRLLTGFKHAFEIGGMQKIRMRQHR
jgi:hypothetical protein